MEILLELLLVEEETARGDLLYVYSGVQNFSSYHKNKEQKPSMVVDSRPFGKNSSWMPLIPRALNSGDQMDMPRSWAERRSEIAGIVHSTRRTSWEVDSSELDDAWRAETENLKVTRRRRSRRGQKSQH